jgi:hypothetical protein
MVNWIKAIPALWKTKGFVEDGIKGAKKMTENKPGYKTTEFWLDMATKVGVLWGAVSGMIPPKYAAIIAVAGTAVYTVARTVLKAVNDIKSQTKTTKVETPTVEVNTKVS